MTKKFFPAPNKKSINEQEQTTLKYWQERDIFQKSINTRNQNYSYKFFDGPPFATGLPHYGHILAGTIKDAIPRYKTMKGYRVDRKWGWDCHGVPVEFLVEKEHQIGGKPGIEKMGVGPFNELCRGVVQRCANDWKDTVSRMGRFVDFEQDYRTMDPEFMESVWWVFGELWNKGLIYEGEKVVAYSPKLGSPLSNFEANLNYQNIQNDKTVTAKFKIIDLPKNISIREIKDDEWDVFTQMVNEEFYTPFNRTQKTSLELKTENTAFVAVDEKDKILGISSYRENNNSVELRYLVVKKSAQKNGIGKSLATKVFESLKNKYDTCSIKAIESAIPFYQSFSPKHTKNFIDLPNGKHEFLEIDLKNFSTKHTSFLAWTTTPWTLPSNLALCVNPKLEYAKVEKDNEFFIVAQNLVEKIFGEDTQIRETIKGKDLVGKKYQPLFDFFADTKNAFQVLADEYVSDADGTGIVHQAPNFGEDDARICHENGIQYLSPNPIDENGYFNNANLPDSLNGRYFRFDPEVDGSKEHNANDWVLANLGEKIFEKGQSTHSYPHCWRTDCALMYRGINTWFVDVQKIKQLMVEKNQDINWLPEHLRDGRFGKLLETAPDWAISRNRYWGCPIPVWKCSVTGKTQVVTSAQQLENLSGQKVDDLHKHFVDELTWKSPFDANGIMKRIEEVLDCWFESGAMPYASVHYPFSKQNYINFQNDCSIVRHAESENNVLEIYNSNLADVDKYGLSEAGKKQAETAAKSAEKFDIIVSSPFRRTKETAEYFAKHAGTKVVIDERLKEIELGEFDGKKHRDFSGDNAHEKTGKTGESLAECQERMLDIVNEYNQKHVGKKILFISHGGPAGTLVDGLNGKLCAWSGMEQLLKNAEVHSLNEIQQKSILENFQPADFIAEGIDQTRGWFYSLHVLGCALFGKNMYQNVITNGIILAEDGQKMSKSKKNYPDPNLIFEKYGADAMRFYLLSSPVVRGENFRFAEHGVAEVLKSIILPLKSTYQFFSTYANIDEWNPTRFVFVRHGEGDHNIARVYSGDANNTHALTKNGKAQIEEIAEFLPKFDAMVASPFVRTKETAEIIKNIQNFDGEILIDDRVQEPYFGDLEGKNWIHPAKRYANKTTECPLKVQVRINDFIHEMSQKFEGKTVFVASHGSPIRNADCYQSNITDLPDMMRVPYTGTGKFKTVFALPNTKNELDLWILSELQSVIKHFNTHMDAYNIEVALRPIAPFVDNLNNWYLRRNRRRFWANGLDADKKSGYTTLHYVLITLSKILAPICPFFAEKLFQDLGGSGSVHLEVLPETRQEWINETLEKQVSVSREIVALAAGIRARAKIKLRQPLETLSFLTTETVQLDLDVIKSEANVKNVQILSETELSQFATKIIRVNARMVGKKFGKKVQELIKAGKAGNFEILTSGQAKVAGEILEIGEFEVAFLTQEGVEAEATTRTVVLLETEISEALATEGMSREIIRAIQENRKNSGFEVSDRINIFYQTSSEMAKKAFEDFGTKIAQETLAESIQKKDLETNEIQIDGETVQLMLEKI